MSTRRVIVVISMETRRTTTVVRRTRIGRNLACIGREGSGGYRQLGSQICMFHVACEIGSPVRIGYIQAKFVMTAAT
jgi:hypothetical protein